MYRQTKGEDGGVSFKKGKIQEYRTRRLGSPHPVCHRKKMKQKRTANEERREGVRTKEGGERAAQIRHATDEKGGKPKGGRRFVSVLLEKTERWVWKWKGNGIFQAPLICVGSSKHVGKQPTQGSVALVTGDKQNRHRGAGFNTFRSKKRQ